MKKKLHFIFLLSIFLITPPLRAAIKIGTPLYSPPFAIHIKGIPSQGFDIELMQLICKKLAWDCEFIGFPFEKLLPALKENKIDFAIGGLSITKEREESFIFSLPYLPSQGSFIRKKTSLFYSLADLKNKKIGALKDKIYWQYLNTEHVLPMKPIPFAEYAEMMYALDKNTIDAAFVNHYAALYLEHRYPELLDALEDKINLGQGLGIVSLPLNQDKIVLINHLILEFQADGTFEKIYNYNFLFFTKSS